jgi:heme A synthase
LNTRTTFRILGAALGIQLALGGLVTFNFLDPSVHTVWGIVLGIVAVLNLVYVMRMPGRPRPLVGLSIGIGVDILIQGLLGFAVIGTSSNANLSNGLAWVHFLNALAIFAMTIFGTVMAMTGARISQAHQMGPAAQ